MICYYTNTTNKQNNHRQTHTTIKHVDIIFSLFFCGLCFSLSMLNPHICWIHLLLKASAPSVNIIHCIPYHCTLQIARYKSKRILCQMHFCSLCYGNMLTIQVNEIVSAITWCVIKRFLTKSYQFSIQVVEVKAFMAKLLISASLPLSSES